MNKKLLMSGAEYFSVLELNPYSKTDTQPDQNTAINEHNELIRLFTSLGAEIVKVDPPKDCQDGIYTANWGLVRGNNVLLSNLPNKRSTEQGYARQVFQDLGYKTLSVNCRFSGQGDALPCGDLLFLGQNYRTDPEVKQTIEHFLGYKVVQLQTVPLLNSVGQPVINKITGWPDSFYYDIDLALAVINKDLIAWCPEAFTPDSRQKIESLQVDKIIVDEDEAMQFFACNLVSMGKDVVMSGGASKLKTSLENLGYKVHVPNMTEIPKGGGYIRCVTNTLE